MTKQKVEKCEREKETACQEGRARNREETGG